MRYITIMAGLHVLINDRPKFHNKIFRHFPHSNFCNAFTNTRYCYKYRIVNKFTLYDTLFDISYSFELGIWIKRQQKKMRRVSIGRAIETSICLAVKKRFENQLDTKFGDTSGTCGWCVSLFCHISMAVSRIVREREPLRALPSSVKAICVSR